MTEPAAGWYRDPANGSAWRWWDGATWTAHVRADEQAVAAVPTAPAEPTPPGPVPQPGQAAAGPATVGGPVTSTADIPVTDQQYWHSLAAEVIEVPRLPHHTVSAEVGPLGRSAPAYVRDWQDLGSPQTAGIWLLAALPLMSIPIALAMSIAFAIGGLPFGNVAASGVVLGLCWVFGYFDMRSLAARGYHRPSIWWMLLLPPLFYFIARGRSVRRENMRAWPPELLYVATYLLIVAALFLSAYSAAVTTGVLPSIG
jgi:hypothetical protein